MLDPLYVASGFAVGLLVGMTGVGGGSLMTPLLILLFGVHPSTAVGTDLLYAAATKTGGSVVHGWSRSVHWPAVLRLACGSIPASAVTLLVLWKLDLKTDAERSLVNLVLCFALLLTATSLIFRKSIMDRYRKRLQQVDARTTLIATVITGVVLGVLVSISSVGAGAVGVTVLLLLYPRLPMAAIVGSDIAHAVPLTLVAGIGHWALGDVDWGPDGRAAAGLAARHHRRQLQRDARARDGAAPDARLRPVRGRRQDHLRGTEPVVGHRHGSGLEPLSAKPAPRSCFRRMG
ncbi:putative membrane protein YfcA [Bradyrhizobium sp. USDA 326]